MVSFYQIVVGVDTSDVGWGQFCQCMQKMASYILVPCSPATSRQLKEATTWVVGSSSPSSLEKQQHWLEWAEHPFLIWSDRQLSSHQTHWQLILLALTFFLPPDQYPRTSSPTPSPASNHQRTLWQAQIIPSTWVETAFNWEIEKLL